jgi:precorrin-2 dehydrogenase / sirohydrochlorin ferrochelatase
LPQIEKSHELAGERRQNESTITNTMNRQPPAKVFPLFLKLENRPCLVVGAGTLAEGKIAGLLEAEAKVQVVAPAATPQVELWAEAGKLDWNRRGFQPGDLEGMFLVVAATSSTPLHEQIFAEARRQGVLCNVVDVPHLCDFYYPAIVRRGALQIAISTAGESPALAQRLRKELEVQFGSEYEGWVTALGEARAEIATRDLSLEDRKELLHQLASDEFFQIFRERRKKATEQKS